MPEGHGLKRGDTYEDLADATHRGVLDSTPLRRSDRFRHAYTVELDDWNRVVANLLAQVVVDARTIDEAARLLGLTAREVEQRSHWALHLGLDTLSHPSYVVVVGPWLEIKR
ncbi:hypothetical protein G6O69_20970 [Pseudenhygromyxa sp. WMMC2535]|uniref:hypothetical protein n=1 Tax=Pseudenhygromyxa sp. WMMC2535 TaxID=2712867 RepID=UPI0015545738|nr:hypothetical protein [Pseudenhygromyxa sp. WMMC2535]NVB40326.1 hypothetical protein [Pseudenhygromyxa sp. WMMC2535]